MEQADRPERPARITVRRITVAPGVAERMTRAQYDPWARDAELDSLAALMRKAPAPGHGGE